MARFVRIHSAVINLDEVRQAHFTEHLTDPMLWIDVGGKPLEINGSQATVAWAKLLQTLEPEEWTAPHRL